MTHICKTGMSNCVLISPPLKKPFGLVELGWTGYPMRLLFWGFFIYNAVQRFALLNCRQLSLREKLCQLCFIELARKQKTSQNCFCFELGNGTLSGGRRRRSLLVLVAPRGRRRPR